MEKVTPVTRYLGDEVVLNVKPNGVVEHSIILDYDYLKLIYPDDQEKYDEAKQIIEKCVHEKWSDTEVVEHFQNLFAKKVGKIVGEELGKPINSFNDFPEEMQEDVHRACEDLWRNIARTVNSSWLYDVCLLTGKETLLIGDPLVPLDREKHTIL
jgi:hypothetical protein